ncbi:MerC domain-containing protein [Allopontixanthobacter sediminis]|nr:MerC domain-containing protein [Allopontixanthobacter sediminis]
MAFTMRSGLPSIRARLDRAGILLSGLCALHCIASIVVVSAIGIGGEWLLAPEIHRYGLVVALLIAAVAIGLGALRHRRMAPFVVAMMGLSFMGGALAVPHGAQEAILTIIGVSLVTLGHILNLRHTHGSLSGRA